MRVLETKPLLPTSTKGSAGPPPPDAQPHALLGMACVAASAVCFSLMTTFIKYNTYSMASMEAVFWRSFVAFIMNYDLYVKPEERMMVLYRSIAGFSSISFAFYAVSQMVLADASVIIFTSPVMTFFFGACLLHEKIDVPSLMCALVSFAGLVCVVRPGFLFGYEHATAGIDGSWIAIGSALLGAIGQTFVFITVRKLRDVNVLVIVHYFMLFSIVLSLLYIAIVQQQFVIPSDITLWGTVIGSGVFTFFGQMFLTKGFQLEKAGIASVMRYLDVVCVFIWDAVLLREHINHWSIIGAAIICTAEIDHHSVVTVLGAPETKPTQSSFPNWPRPAQASNTSNSQVFLAMSPKKEDTPLLLLPLTTANVENSALEPGKQAPDAMKSFGDDSQPHKLLGMACVAASAVCFSIMSTFVKYDTHVMTSMEAVFWRSSVAGVLNYGVILYSGQSVRLEPQDRLVMLYRVIAGFCSIAFQFYAISQMVLADASVIIFTSPVITFFLGAFMLHERIDPVSLLCAFVSFGGLICVVRPEFLFGSDHATVSTDGSLLAVCSGILGAVGQAFVYVLVRKLKHINVSVILHYFMLFSTISSLLYIGIFQRKFVIPDTLPVWCGVIGSGVFTFFGQMFLTKGFQLEKAGIASVMRYLDVVCVFIWDAVLLREHINHWSIIGAAIICTCAIVIALQKMKTTS